MERLLQMTRRREERGIPMSSDKLLVHQGKQTQTHPAPPMGDTGKALPWLRSWWALVHPPLESVAWIMQCVGIRNPIHTFSSVYKPPLASTPLAEDPTP